MYAIIVILLLFSPFWLYALGSLLGYSDAESSKTKNENEEAGIVDRYVLPMPGTQHHNYQMHKNAQYYAVKGTKTWRPDAIALGTDDAVKHGYTVTQSDIDAAPAWVKAIKPLKVTDDEK